MPLHLVLDAGSPLVSVAAARDGAVLAARAVGMERSSSQLLSLIDEVLHEIGAQPSDLDGVAALRGPGSFTGLRIGLATVLGFHQALGLRATALDTLQVLAASGPPPPGLPHPSSPVIAAVDALRGEWSAQVFAIDREGPPRALGGMVLVPAREIPALGPHPPGLDGGEGLSVIGFGVSRLAEDPGWPRDVRRVEAGPLAPTAARLLAHPAVVWNAALLTAPLYARPPAITLPRGRTAAVAARS